MKIRMLSLCSLWLMTACATGVADHFYILTPQPAAPSANRPPPGTVVSLTVSVPSLVDRPEMVFNTAADGVLVFEHERWAAPFADLAAHTLARDLERRRADVLVAERADGVAHAAAVKMTLDVVQVNIYRGGRASLETQWRVLDARTGKDVIGADVFTAELKDDSYAAAAQALSDCLGLAADRLAAQLAAAE
jgi:uncharacterized lipoprotein YmbA